MFQELLYCLMGLLTLVYMYFRYTYNYWINKEIVQETPTFPFGNLLDPVLNRKNVGWIYNELYFKHKNNEAVGLYEFQTPKLLVRTPKLIENVLIKDFSSFSDNEVYANLKVDPFLELDAFVMKGDKWKPARNSLIKGLTTSKLKDMYELMKSTIPHLKSYVDDHLGDEISAQELAHLFMMTNVSNAVYGIESNCFTDPNAKIRKVVKMFTEGYWQSWLKVLIVFHMQRLRDFLGYGFIPKKVSIFVEDMMRQVINFRLKNNIHRNDFLNYYLSLDKSEEEKTYEIINNGLTFFIGGFETSGLPSGNVLYELALNPTIQENLYNELYEAYDGKMYLDYNTLMSLPYLDKVVKETLRKYPLLYGSMKVCTATTTLEIDGRTVVIDKETPVVIPVYAVHHDPQYFPDPEVFDPERFTDEAMESRPPCTWMPFGAGPRICAGMKFGLLQIKLFLASIIYYYKLETTERTPPMVTLKKSAFLPVPEEVQWIRIIKRN